MRYFAFFAFFCQYLRGIRILLFFFPRKDKSFQRARTERFSVFCQQIVPGNVFPLCGGKSRIHFEPVVFVKQNFQCVRIRNDDSVHSGVKSERYERQKQIQHVYEKNCESKTDVIQKNYVALPETFFQAVFHEAFYGKKPLQR
jgi:hypothetical protein